MANTLWDLPPQRLPKSNVVDSTFVTIWAFVCILFVALFTLKLRGPKPTWPEFGNIRDSSILLAIFYCITAIDRWLHYEQRAVTLGYILLEPISQILSLLSTLWYLWGTYIVLWNDLERRFRQDEKPGYWWLAAKIVIFIVFLVSFFFAGLNIAARVAWLQFFALNVIADVATKRNHFEMAMTACFTIFGLFTILAAVATLIVRSYVNNGTWAKTQIYVLVATIMLFLRSLTEFVISILVHTTPTRRADTRVACNIITGLLTTLYLVFMYLQSAQVARLLDMGSDEADNVKSDVRSHILRKLETITNQHQSEAPPFAIILDQTLKSIPTILQEGPLSSTSSLTAENKQKVAEKYIRQLRRQEGKLGERPDPDPAQPAVRPVYPHNGGRAGPYDSSGHRSAPMPSSTAYDILRAQASGSNMRTTASMSNIRTGDGSGVDATRFGQRYDDTTTVFGQRQPRMPPVQEYPAPGPTGLHSHPLPPPVLPIDGHQGLLPMPGTDHRNRPGLQPAGPTNDNYPTTRPWPGSTQQPQPSAGTPGRRRFDPHAPTGEDTSSHPHLYGAAVQPLEPDSHQQQHPGPPHQDPPAELGNMTPRPSVLPTTHHDIPHGQGQGTQGRRHFSDPQFPARPPSSQYQPFRPAANEGHHRAVTDPILLAQQQRHLQQAQQQLHHPPQPAAAPPPPPPPQHDMISQPSTHFSLGPTAYDDAATVSSALQSSVHLPAAASQEPQLPYQARAPYQESVTTGRRSPLNFVYETRAPPASGISGPSSRETL